MSVYAKDSADHLERALTSAVLDQSLYPDEVVLVQDGPVGVALERTIERFVASCPVPVHHLVMPENRGLAAALTLGLQSCSHDIVARMDADDIAMPHRFERQLAAFHDRRLDLLGTGMFEFAENGSGIVARRTPPVGERIDGFARFHDPFNHPTVVYRRSAVLRAGGYRPMGLMEDYWLFARMIMTKAAVDNLAEPLLMYRVDSGAYSRRGGLGQLRAELRLQRAFRHSGFTTSGQMARNIIVRGGYRLIPTAIRRALYRATLARKDDGVDRSSAEVGR
ncbi:glycosyltransferase [Naasia lichenicola]|uniref:Glycosyltransferase n=2 Tax=Naasia lichenicola TaxID=2565933 RepID=A0A4S4FLN7_9MICO|nr:glycosyltransferase [Naasia lichenicola]